VHDYDLDTGTWSNRREFINSNLLGYDGEADGFCFDTEGGVWSAQ